MDDWLELSGEVVALEQRLHDLMARFAKAIEHIHEQIDEQADYETRTFREMATVSATSQCQ